MNNGDEKIIIDATPDPDDAKQDGRYSPNEYRLMMRGYAQGVVDAIEREYGPTYDGLMILKKRLQISENDPWKPLWVFRNTVSDDVNKHPSIYRANW